MGVNLPICQEPRHRQYSTVTAFSKTYYAGILFYYTYNGKDITLIVANFESVPFALLTVKQAV